MDELEVDSERLARAGALAGCGLWELGASFLDAADGSRQEWR